MNDRDWLALLKTANHEFATRLSAVTDWDAPTPDTDWTVRDLAAHVIEEQQWVPHLLAGRTVEQARRELAPLGDDLFAEWRLYSLGAAAAWNNVEPGAIVNLSRDRVPVEDYLRELVSDVTIHTWDLARAIGAPEQLDPELVDAVWTVFEPQQETLAASGLYAAPVALPDDAPLQSRLLAVTGRDDRIAA
ncbi:MAG: TIGR03086 family metal-binding protein [Lacisediminihabitans sp.]